MKLSKKLAAVAAVGLAMGVLFVAGRAVANPGDCKVTVTTLVHRPDSGNGQPADAPWALDHITRTVTICEGDAVTTDELPVDRQAAPQVAIGWSHYKATVEDTGTFVTNAGATLSPARGENLVGDLPGTLTGHFTVNFIAVDNFGNYGHVYDGNTYSGTDPIDTTHFVQGDWGGRDFVGLNGKGQPDEVSGGQQDDWTWTYKTCNEQWVDAYSDKAGSQEPAAGDITGATECPKPSPTPTPTHTVSPSPTPTTTTTPAPVPTTVTTTVTVTG